MIAHVLHVIASFVVGTGMGYVANVWLAQGQLGYDSRIGWGFAIAFGLIVAVGVAFRVDERI